MSQVKKKKKFLVNGRLTRNITTENGDSSFFSFKGTGNHIDKGTMKINFRNIKTIIHFALRRFCEKILTEAGRVCHFFKDSLHFFYPVSHGIHVVK